MRRLKIEVDDSGQLELVIGSTVITTIEELRPFLGCRLNTIEENIENTNSASLQRGKLSIFKRPERSIEFFFESRP